MNDKHTISRKDVLATLAAVPAMALAVTGATQAAGASKSAMKYQSTPKDGHACAGCKFFKPGKTPHADGTCSVVAGSISPKGWCIAWSAK